MLDVLAALRRELIRAECWQERGGGPHRITTHLLPRLRPVS
jgi:hypothetical protein